MEKVVDSGEIAAGGGTSVQLTWYSSNLIMLRGLNNMDTHDGPKIFCSPPRRPVPVYIVEDCFCNVGDIALKDECYCLAAVAILQ